MLKLVTNIENFYNDLLDIAKLFYHDWANVDVEISAIENLTSCYDYDITINEFHYREQCPITAPTNHLEDKRRHLRQNQRALYNALREFTNVEHPWGSLTGIRPGKLAYDVIGSVPYEELAKYYEKNFFLSSDKAQLIQDVVINQKNYYFKSDNLVNLYIHIPFCPSRCYYCSFISSTIDQLKRFVEPYIDNLITEIKDALDLIERSGKLIHSIYIGGGTPTAISDDQFERVLAALPQSKLCSDSLKLHNSDANLHLQNTSSLTYRHALSSVEITCEAGRPDTITQSKLELMAKYNVTRISINPQTVNDDTLTRIGRKHSSKQFFDVYNCARKFKFDINVDLIAGLDGESFADFQRSVDEVIAINPENITVHTLCRKNGADLKKQPVIDSCNIDEMVTYSIEKLTASGYLPYYLYRQKSMLGNLENVGYCKVDTQCAFNISTMEESLGVVACGAGAISKKICIATNKIDRHANIKDVKLYNEQFAERLAKKRKFFEN